MNFDEYKNLVNHTLKEYFEEFKQNAKYEKTLFESMSYTTLLGGKRLRAVFCLEMCRSLCGFWERALPSACAYEMLHAQSLIHDDLPCMDNDDLRRQKPSNHKVFGEAMAVLSGDALISLGAQVIIEKTPKEINKETLLNVVKCYLKAAGAFGIVAGQCADIEAEKSERAISAQHLKYIHTYKTSALFEAAMLSGAYLGGADDDKLKKVKDFALNFGLLFQIYDDILDVISTTKELGKTAGKDAKENKATYVTLFSLDGAKEKFNELNLKCHDILNKEFNSEIFAEVLDKMCERVK